jgi:hypothetical protein
MWWLWSLANMTCSTMIYAMYRYFENQLKESIVEFEDRREQTMRQYAIISNKLHRIKCETEHAFSKYEDTWDEETKGIIIKIQKQNLDMIDLMESVLSG